MITGTTASGFSYSIPENTFDDMRLVDALAGIESNPLEISNVTLLLLGREQRARLYERLKREDGTVPPEAVERELIEIMQSRGKNS